jgi:hypothetical protein
MQAMEADSTTRSIRFRKVSNKYPRRVSEAYGGDLSRAMADSDEEVAATVAGWSEHRACSLGIGTRLVAKRDASSGGRTAPANALAARR